MNAHSPFTIYPFRSQMLRLFMVAAMALFIVGCEKSGSDNDDGDAGSSSSSSTTTSGRSSLEVLLRDMASGQPNLVRVGIQLRNTGEVPIESPTAYYYFTTEGGREPTLDTYDKKPQKTGPEKTFCTVELEKIGVDEYRLAFDCDGLRLNPGKRYRPAVNDVGLYFADGRPWNRNNDYSYKNNDGTWVKTNKISVFSKDGQLINGIDPLLDQDGDGIFDPLDDDRDGDGVNNDVDAFPDDKTESSDLDGDGIGDNKDTDRDGDGVENDTDKFPNDPSESKDSDGDGTGDNADKDRDGDGVPNKNDAFPDDPNESRDLDGDGIGNNSDPDRDGDGVDNGDDAFPSDPAESSDLDGDGVGDNADPDKDGDGEPNETDAFPLDPSESKDLDGDGVGDNKDNDRDGDGIPNDQDQFPNDPSASSDLDKDGIPDSQDSDRDGDGVPNEADAFPGDPNETSDLDGDGVGDNADTDRDGDGTPNDQDDFPNDPTRAKDLDGDGIDDTRDPDIDGDGVVNGNDAFPRDPNESADLDGDGIGDNADPDKDGDGVNNDQDAFPADPNESSDLDGDGIGDNADADKDGDGIDNGDDAFPTDPNESSDLDGDGIGDNADTDKDGDGVENDQDAFPDDPTETSDLDGDGVGDNTDLDIDGDGVNNDQDAFPNDPNESKDLDGDGIGDNADTDRDGDGVNNDLDLFPDDPSETSDLDGDGIGDNADTDRDNDGVDNDVDAFPNDPSESSDLDGDGQGDNTDSDRDGDGIDNDDDTFPDDPNESTDLDGDGIGDNSDPDRDNDGVENDQDAFPDDDSESSDLDGDGIGDNADPDRDGDGVPNEDDYFPDDPEASSVPTVSLLEPETLTTVGASPITVSGTVDDVNAVITINGEPVENNEGQFQAQVELEEGHNTISVRAIDNKGHAGTATASVSLDTTPPNITVESPIAGSTVSTETISVAGLVNDIVRGTVEERQAVVVVKDVVAAIDNRSYLASSVRLAEGENNIRITATDAVGNTATINHIVNYQPIVGKQIISVGGQDQSGTIRTQVAEPLAVKLTDEAGEPVVDKIVVFRVIQGDGVVWGDADGEDDGYIATTNADGIASAQFRLGSRAGVGIHKVRAKAVGFDGEVVFYASATTNPGDKINVIAGNNQRGSVRQPLPQPFTVAVTDAGSNLVEGAQVEFKVSLGGGHFQNEEPIFQTTTDSDGRASVYLTLGPDEGMDVQRVTAQLQGTEAKAVFTASGFVPGDPGDTKISGVVLDNQDNPLPGVVVRVESVNRQATTDDQGQFEIEQVPVGPVHLLVDGSTTTVEGEWPTLSYNIVTVPGIENTLERPVYLVKLDTENAQLVGNEDVDFTLEEVPGFKLEVKAGSVTFPDGSKSGLLSVTPVNANKVPMPPPNGMQPQLIVTIQPAGTAFDPPAAITLPNVDGHAPGAQVEMYSYDHDLEEFVTIGLGTVSADGSVIGSNPGVGVIKAGWHCGSQPSGSGCCSGGGNKGGCGQCKKRVGKCEDSKCVPDNSQDPGLCKACSGGSVVNDDSEDPKQECKQCKGGKVAPDDSQTPKEECKKCEGGSPVPDEGKDNLPCGDQNSDQEKCYTCKDGNCGNQCDASDDTDEIKITSDDLIQQGVHRLSQGLGAVPFMRTSIDVSISGSRTTGEECCKDCTEGPAPKPYQEYKVEGGVTGTATIVPPGLGFITDFGPYRREFRGDTYEIDASLTFGLFLEGQLSAKAEYSYRLSECFNNPKCHKVDLSLGPTLTGGVTGRVSGSLKRVRKGGRNRGDDDDDDDDDGDDDDGGEDDNSLIGISGKLESALQAKANVKVTVYGGEDCPASTCTYGFDGLEYIGEASITVETTYFDFSFSKQIKQKLLDSTAGPCRG